MERTPGHEPDLTHETHGSPQRPPRRLAGPGLRFTLGEELASIKQEPAWQRSDRNARTLVEEPGLRLTLIALKAGAVIEEQTTNGWFSIQPIEGRLRIRVAGEESELGPGQVIVVDRNVPHAIEAVDESGVVLTMARPTG